MSSITFNREGVPVNAVTLTDSPDAHNLIIKTEHSDSKPSTIELRRKLPSATGTVRRTFLNRTIGVVINPGTEMEQYATVIGKLELSVPIGADDLDVQRCIDDLVGVAATAEFTDLRTYGILP